MRSSILIKLAVLAPVVFATWFATKSLLAGNPKPSAEVFVGEWAKEGPAPLAAEAKGAQIFMTYEYKPAGFGVQLDGNQAIVSCAVDMTDRVGDKAYLWRLQALREGSNEPVVDVSYEGQMFSIHPSGRMTPNFSEKLELPTGSYRVLVTLYAVPIGYDTTQLKDEAKARQAMVARNGDKVEIR